MRLRAALLLLLLAAAAPGADVFSYHEVRLDSSGRIVPWYGPSRAYDHVVRLVFRFRNGMERCPNGVPYYLQHQVWKPGAHDPRGLGGDQIPMALSSWNLLYGYLGDEAVKKNMIFMADYWLDHGMSAAGDLWANLPYPYNTDLHSGVHDGDMRAGKGFVQPDKAASFAAEPVTLWKMTGNRRYLEASTGIADTLAARVRPGGAGNSPWPCRVHAKTGEVHRQKDKAGRESVASYTTNCTGTLRLFEDLAQLQHGDTRAYARAREIVVRWLKTYPLRTNKWEPFFENIPTSTDSGTEINADALAMYILEHPEWDPDRRKQAAGVLGWSFRTFANHEFEKWGVTAINEQTACRVPGNSHTSRHASVELLYVDTDGENRYPRDDNWLTDGYGDYVRHYLRVMASAPELAPASIEYGEDRIRYTKFDVRSAGRFKLGGWTPKSVTGGAFTWSPTDNVLEIRSNVKSVSIGKR